MKDMVREVLKSIRCLIETANPVVEKSFYRRIWVSPKVHDDSEFGITIKSRE